MADNSTNKGSYFHLPTIILVVACIALVLWGLNQETKNEEYAGLTKNRTEGEIAKEELHNLAMRKRAKMEQDSINGVNGTSSDPLIDSMYKVDKLKFNKLKAAFSFHKDKFTNTTWYEPKSQKNSLRTTLLVHVNNSGWIYLESQYHSDDWIFHTHFQMLVNGKNYTSPVVESYNENNKTDAVGGSVYENVSYLDESIHDIISTIAENSKKQIDIRFVGKQYRHDIVLSAKDKIAIKDAWEFSRYLKNGFGDNL